MLIDLKLYQIALIRAGIPQADIPKELCVLDQSEINLVRSTAYDGWFFPREVDEINRELSPTAQRVCIFVHVIARTRPPQDLARAQYYAVLLGPTTPSPSDSPVKVSKSSPQTSIFQKTPCFLRRLLYSRASGNHKRRLSKD